MSDEKLRQLEEKLEALVRASRRVRERYQASLTREASLREERADLLKKNPNLATGAATLAAGRLSEEIGLERGAQRLFGLEIAYMLAYENVRTD